MSLRSLSVADLHVRGERAFRAITPYAALKKRLVADGYRFLAPPLGSAHAHLDRVTLLNHTSWSVTDGNDVLVDEHIDADVLTHVAWHHVIRRALRNDLAPTASALLLGESVASAFDLYVVGRLLHTSPRADYLRTQVPAMSGAAAEAGLDPEACAALFDAAATDPEQAFEALRQLLFDVSSALYVAPDVHASMAILERHEGHAFFGLLHHYALSTWVLFARSHAGVAVVDDPAVRADQAMRAAPVSLDWLLAEWV